MEGDVEPKINHTASTLRLAILVPCFLPEQDFGKQVE